MNNNPNNRNKLIKARVTEDEEILVKTKAKLYGYKNLSKYLVDAAIYEKITHIDLENQMEIYNAYALYTRELKKITKDIKHICKYATQLNNDNISTLTSLIFAITNNQKEMLKLIDEKLDLRVWQEINRNKDIQEE